MFNNANWIKLNLGQIGSSGILVIQGRIKGFTQNRSGILVTQGRIQYFTQNRSGILVIQGRIKLLGQNMSGILPSKAGFIMLTLQALFSSVVLLRQTHLRNLTYC